MTGVPQALNNDRIGVEDALAFVFGDLVRELSPIVHRVVGWQLVFLSDNEVFLAVSRSGVNASRSRVQGHVIAQNDVTGPVDEGVTGDHSVETGSRLFFAGQ